MLETAKPLTLRNWLVLFTSFVILAVAFGFSLFCWPAIYRPLTVAHGWTSAGANAGGAIILLLIGLLSPLVGSLIDRFQPKLVIVAGTCLTGTAFALLSTIHSLPQYYACCVLLGTGAAAVSIMPASILISPFFLRWRGLAVGFINAGIGLGGFIAPRLATKEIANRGIPGTFLVLAGCMSIPLILTLSLVRNSETHRVSGAPESIPPSRQLMRMPMFWIFGVALFFNAHAMLGVQQNIISYLTDQRVNSGTAALVLAVALGAAAPGRMINGFIADRVNARTGVICSVVFVALGIFSLLKVPPQSTLVYWVAIVFGLGYGGIFNATPTIVFETFGTHRVGRHMGLFYIFFGLGAASGGEMAAWLFDQTRSWRAAFTLDLVLACAGLLLLLLFKHRSLLINPPGLALSRCEPHSASVRYSSISASSRM